MSLPGISENLIEQLNHGSTKAFDEIYHTYHLYLRVIAAYYVHDKRVVGEIVNGAFVTFWQDRYHIIHPVLPYLRCAIQNANISYLRSSYSNEKQMTERMEEIRAFLENHILSSDNPLQVLEHSEIDTIIMKKVEELPAKRRAMLGASLYEGKTYSKIAEEQSINMAIIRVQIKIALTKSYGSLGVPYMVTISMLL